VARPPKSKGVDPVGRKPASKRGGGKSKYYIATDGIYKTSKFVGIKGNAIGEAGKRTPEIIHAKQAETPSGTATKPESGSDAPQLIVDQASNSSSNPDMVTDAAKRRDADPDMVTDAAKQKGADPDMVTDAAKRRGADPDMVTDAAKRRGADPDMVTDAAKRRGADPDMVTDAAKRRSPDAEIIRARSRRASTKTQMVPVQAPTKDDAVSSPDSPKRRRVPPEDVVNAFVNDFALEIDRLGIEMSVKQRESMKVEFSTPNQDLIVAFEARELPFDKIVVKQYDGQVHETGGIDASKRAQPQASEFLAALTNLLGRKTGKGTADGEVSRNVQHRVAPAQDHGTHSFAWNGTRLKPGVASGGNDRIVLTAELFESNTQHSWLIELIDSRQAVGDKQDAGKELSPAGIRRLLAPLLVGLGSATHGDVGSIL